MDKWTFCLATGVSSAEYENMTVFEKGVVVEAYNKLAKTRNG